MSSRPDTLLARLLALLIPSALLAGAWGSQLLGGLYPCEMCHWQRWPHYAAIVLAALSFFAPRTSAKRLLVILAGPVNEVRAMITGWWRVPEEPRP